MNTSRVEELIQQIRSLPDPHARGVALDLVQSVMDFHASGLARMMEIVSEADPNGNLMAALASDDLTSSLLLLHDLHPLDLQARIQRALEQLSVNARGARVDLVSIDGGVVRVRIEGGPVPGLKSAVEIALSNAAPDAASIVIEGAEENLHAANFVPLEQLLAT